ACAVGPVYVFIAPPFWPGGSSPRSTSHFKRYGAAAQRPKAAHDRRKKVMRLSFSSGAPEGAGRKDGIGQDERTGQAAPRAHDRVWAQCTPCIFELCKPTHTTRQADS